VIDLDRWHGLRCGHCGRFTEGVDEYTPWGGSGDLEPPDPVILCTRCSAQDFKKYVAALREKGIPHSRHRPTWYSSDAWRMAVAVVRMERKHGRRLPARHSEARVELGGGLRVRYCGKCGRPEKHPSHDGAEAHRLRIRWCPDFKWAVEKPVRQGWWRVICTCGWHSAKLQVSSFSFIEREVLNEHIREAA
jgi:hypothetical protein